MENTKKKYWEQEKQRQQRSKSLYDAVRGHSWFLCAADALLVQAWATRREPLEFNEVPVAANGPPCRPFSLPFSLALTHTRTHIFHSFSLEIFLRRLQNIYRNPLFFGLNRSCTWNFWAFFCVVGLSGSPSTTSWMRNERRLMPQPAGSWRIKRNHIKSAVALRLFRIFPLFFHLLHHLHRTTQNSRRFSLWKSEMQVERCISSFLVQPNASVFFSRLTFVHEEQRGVLQDVRTEILWKTQENESILCIGIS